MAGIERDEFFVGERALFDAAVLVGGVPAPSMAGTTMQLRIQPPADDTGTPRPEETPAVTFNPASVAHAAYTALYEGWHEWRWEATGTIVGAAQGRFRVTPVNV
jgi:hypothetical protein